MISMLIKWFIFGLLSLPMKLITTILAPIAVIFSFYTKDQNLPRCFYWMQTHDAHLDEGLKPFYFGPATSKFDLYKKRVKWVMRNTAYAFSASYMGIINHKTKVLYHKNNYTHQDGGWEFLLVENSFKQLAFMFRCRYKSPFSTSKQRRKIQFYSGWELQRTEEPTFMCAGNSIQLWTKW